MLEKRFKGEGEILDDLEWDVKAYFTQAEPCMIRQ